jgi:uncharacterized protein YbbC (DUF1343 family)
MLGEIAGGSGVSIGNLFKKPFECVAATWLNGDSLSRQMSHYGFQGVSFPVFNITHDGRQYCGVRLQFSDPAHAPLVAINFYTLEALKKVSGRDLFVEAAKSGRRFDMFDKVCGTDAVRRALQAGVSASTIVNSWKKDEEAFRKQRQPHLLY